MDDTMRLTQWSLKLSQTVWEGWRQRPPTSDDPYHDCPVCRHGRLSSMMLMDTMACDFCRHIFSVDLSAPLVQPLTLRLEDSTQPIFWQWTGTRWKSQPRAAEPLVRWLWIFCTVMVVLPSMLMGGAVYLFPASGRGAWIAPAWFCLTIGAHLGIALWILAEHYQWPVYVRLQLLWERVSF